MLLEKAFPFMKWMKKYDKKDFFSDFVAGLTVAVILIPQSMAYAMIAGLPPIYGLYAGFLGVAVASLWGSSPQLATGPVALVSFLTMTSLMTIAKPESPEFIALAIMLAIIVGIIQLSMGIFKLGFIMNFISHSVVVGFSNAAAIIIATSQVPSLLGIKIEQHEEVFKTFYDIIINLVNTNIPTLIVGIIAIILILVFKKIHKLFPAALIVLIIGIITTYKFGLNDMGVSIIKDIPAGLPKFSLPTISLDNIHNMIGKGLIISIIGFMEAYAIAKSISTKTKQKLDVNQELIGQGLANITSGFLKGYPISGSFSRSAVNFSAGARTGMSSVFTVLFVGVALLFLTETLYYLPKAVLAGIVIVAVSGLINVKEFKHLYKMNRTDGIVAITTFAFAFIMKPDYAIFVGIILSLILFLYKTITPRINEISKEEKTQRFKNIEKYELKICPQIMFMKPERSLYFANAETILNKIQERVKSRKDNLKYLVIDFESINYCDVSAIDVLKVFIEDLKEINIEVYFSNVTGKIVTTIKHSELKFMSDEGRILEGKKEVIEKLFPLLDVKFCKGCPNKIFNECKNV
ncbi:MAG: SulP family inorganic anion transporter [Candidatus Gracilibacteria bacterium]|nr:SulP family inorganic anion transporter [Candidatus Gracilibacteria bacterium]